MAIIYSYPKVITLNNSDLLIGSRFENGDSGEARTISFTLETLTNSIEANLAPTLNQVLTNGNESLQDAKIGTLYLYDTSETDYGQLAIDDSGLVISDAQASTVARIDRGGIILVGTTYNSTLLTGSITANRNYTLPNKSGTIALTSDIPTTTNYGLATQLANSTPIVNTTTKSTLNGSSYAGTLSVPANGFSVGDSFNAYLMGHISNNNGVTLLITVETVAGVVLGSTGTISLNATTDKHWKLDLDFVIRQTGVAGDASIITAGQFSYNKNSNNNAESFTFVTENSTTFNTAIANELVIKAQWGTASASNSIYSNVFILNKVY